MHCLGFLGQRRIYSVDLRGQPIAGVSVLRDLAQNFRSRPACQPSLCLRIWPASVGQHLLLLIQQTGLQQHRGREGPAEQHSAAIPLASLAALGASMKSQGTGLPSQQKPSGTRISCYQQGRNSCCLGVYYLLLFGCPTPSSGQQQARQLIEDLPPWLQLN
ncbi:hypothetical protein WJX84_002669 [Apatococcus fuscideae]|uniref:Uncharacterized protein n=1 Tax=Apatococcus fuscideae TaxID=2026836 RepID=A0AAW1TDU7_9CHLO